MELRVSTSAGKDIRRLDRSVQRLLKHDCFPLIENEPTCGEALRYSFKGLRSFHFRCGAKQYRIVYEIYQEEDMIVVILVGPRENLYERLRRRVLS